jgi:hypothetical protein
VIIEIPAFADSTGRSDPPRGDRGRRNRTRVYLALGVGIGGGVAFGLSAIVGLSAKSSYDSTAESPMCSRNTGRLVCTAEAAQAIEDAGTRADYATGLALAGAVLVTAGIVLYVTAPRETLAVTPVATATSAGVTLSSRF